MAKKETKNSYQTLIVILFILIFLTIGAIWYMFYQMNAGNAGNGENPIANIFEREKEERLYPLEEFTLQLADGRYAKLAMSIGYMSSSEKDEEEFKNGEPILRDVINVELMKMTSDKLEVKQLDSTKKVLIEQLKPLIAKSEVSNVYIEELVVQ